MPAKQSFWQELRKGTLGRFLDLYSFLKQRRALLREPRRIFTASHTALPLSALAFALQGMILSTGSVVLASSVIDLIDPHPTCAQMRLEMAEADEVQKRAKWIPGFADEAFEIVVSMPTNDARQDVAAEEFREKFLTVPLWAVSQLVVGAVVFGFVVRRKLRTANDGHEAERAYLFIVTALLFWPLLLTFTMFEVIEQGCRRGPGPGDEIDLLNAAVFLLFFVWSWVNFWRAGRRISQILGIADQPDESKRRRAVVLRLVLAVLVANAATGLPLVIARHHYEDLRLPQMTP